MIIPGWSTKYLQMATPIIIGAFFHNINIMRYFNSDDLWFITNLTPRDKKWDECDYLNREYIYYTISTYIESGAMGNLSHDRGERAGIGRILEVMYFNNQNYKIDPSWNNGIISVIIDADGVNPNDNDI